MAEIKDGLLNDPAVSHKIFSKIEKGAMDLGKVKGIVIHQTDSQTAQSTFNAYTAGRKNPKTGVIEYYGAHFLIDRGSGTYKENKKDKPYTGIDGKIYQTAHVTQICSHAGRLKSKEYPTNSHSIGIEIVARFDETDGYPTSSVAQVESATWLVTTLIDLISSIGSSDKVYAHGNISYGKKESEGVSSLEQIKKEIEKKKAEDEKKKAEKAKEITIHSSFPFRLPPMAIDNTRVVIRCVPIHFSDNE